MPKSNDITLGGDAAGFIKPWSGGGIIWSLKAADVLIEHFPDFLEYKKAALTFFWAKNLKRKNDNKFSLFFRKKFSLSFAKKS